MALSTYMTVCIITLFSMKYISRYSFLLDVQILLAFKFSLSKNSQMAVTVEYLLWSLLHILLMVYTLKQCNWCPQNENPFISVFKPIANRWVWGSRQIKLKEAQARVKVTTTTLWAAPIRHRRPENLNGKFFTYLRTKTYPEVEEGWEQKGFYSSTSKGNACEMTWPLKEHCKNTGALKKP